MSENELRAELVKACKLLETSGLNRGTSGNISVRHEEFMLITPSAVPYDQLTSEMIAKMALDEQEFVWEGPKKPSSEWQFHRDILRNRNDLHAVVHTHAPYSTILADARKPIPAIHYMIAAFGGVEIKVADYARYGTSQLSNNILSAMLGMNACLMANHGMVVGGGDLPNAMWLAGELESLAHQYYHLLAINDGHILSNEEIAETAEGFKSYGVQAKANRSGDA